MHIIWQVKVYDYTGNSNPEPTIYHFEHRSDVTTSIALTYPKQLNEVKIEEGDGQNGYIIVYERTEGHLLIEARALEFDLLTRATHF